MQRWIGASPDRVTFAGPFDGCDPTYNPSGNMLEGMPWQASTVYALGALSSNNSNVYFLTAAGTSASSGGPSGVGASIVDGSATWAYANRPSGMSNWSAGIAGVQSAAAGVVYSGNLCSGWTIARQSGTSAGTVACAIETPWSNGQLGTRQSIAFSLGSGGASEEWRLQITGLINTNWGIQPADLGVTRFFVEVEYEESGVANFCGAKISLGGSRFSTAAGVSAAGVALHGPSSTGEMVVFPNAGKRYLRSQPAIVHAQNASISVILSAYFDTSGGAGSATATIKINSIALRRANVA
jgi:hypothetical protein